LLRVLIVMLVPEGSERLVARSSSVTVKGPGEEFEPTVNRMWPRSKVAPESTTVPERGVENTSETSKDWPLLDPVKSGPNRECPAKI